MDKLKTPREIITNLGSLNLGLFSLNEDVIKLIELLRSEEANFKVTFSDTSDVDHGYIDELWDFKEIHMKIKDSAGHYFPFDDRMDDDIRRLEEAGLEKIDCKIFAFK